VAYCPNCNFDYDADIRVCPECDEDLIPSLERRGTAAVSPDDSWVAVGTVSDRVKSDMAKGSLDSNNIPSLIVNNYHENRIQETAGAAYIDPEGASLIIVPKEFSGLATEILKSVLGDELLKPENNSLL
jgi:hypothetical protein